jgi:hypothetical protein
VAKRRAKKGAKFVRKGVAKFKNRLRAHKLRKGRDVNAALIAVGMAATAGLLPGGKALLTAAVAQRVIRRRTKKQADQEERLATQAQAGNVSTSAKKKRIGTLQRETTIAASAFTCIPQ